MTVTTLSAEETSETPHLSPAEQAILPLLLAGDREWEIALDLDKAQATVSKQVGAIYRAYGVHSKFQLIARHHEIQARKNLAQNGRAGVNTPAQSARQPPDNRPVARKNGARKRRT